MNSHIRKTTLANFSPVGVRRVLAEEKRIRRKAQRMGLYAAKTRAGWWEIRLWRGGEVIVGQLHDWQAERHLDKLAEKQSPCRRTSDTGRTSPDR